MPGCSISNLEDEREQPSTSRGIRLREDEERELVFESCSESENEKAEDESDSQIAKPQRNVFETFHL